MVTHVVLMKFKPADKLKNLELARERLLAMRGVVPSLRHIEVGLNVVPSERAFDLSLITRFDSLEALQEYAVDPAHVEVKNFLGTVLELSYVVDSLDA